MCASATFLFTSATVARLHKCGDRLAWLINATNSHNRNRTAARSRIGGGVQLIDTTQETTVEQLFDLKCHF
jgi:hypothetical protein